MRLHLTDDQEDLGAAVRRVLDDRCPVELVRRCADDPSAWRPLWEELGSLGWPRLQLPGSADGSDAGVVELAVVMEAAGYVALPAPLGATAAMAIPVALSCGAAPPSLSVLGDGPAALVAAHAGIPAALIDPATRGPWAGAARVRDAPAAVVFVATVLTPEGAGAVVLDAASVHVDAPASVDPTSPTAAVRPGPAGPGGPVLHGDVERGLAVARVGVAAELVGCTARMLDMAVEHARDRRQFGHAIGSFQAIQHRLADAYVALERARSLTYRAAALADGDVPTVEVAVAACLAKGAAGEAGDSVGRSAVQVHGALGMTKELDLHLFLRRAWMLSAQLGTTRQNYAWAARLAAGGGVR